MTIIIRRAFPVAFLILSLLLAGCAATTANLPPETPAMHSLNEFSDDDYVARINDPWEGFNRNMYKFNYYFDKYLYLPVVRGYEFVTPTFAQTGVTNLFNNVAEVRTLYNCLFQLSGEKSLITLGRFVTNTTIGIGGLFDPATSMGLARQNEDFGQTLGYWGVDSGPYLVLPVLGPNTVRSAGGMAVDSGIRYGIYAAIDPFGHYEDGGSIWTGINALEAIDKRHQIKFRYYQSGFPLRILHGPISLPREGRAGGHEVSASHDRV